MNRKKCKNRQTELINISSIKSRSIVILEGGGRKKIGVAGLMVCLWEGKDERGMKQGLLVFF